PDAAAREERLVHQQIRDPCRAFRLRDLPEEGVTRVRRPHPAKALVSVERQAVRLEILAPEHFLESQPERLGFPPLFKSKLSIPHEVRQRGASPTRGVDVRLNLAAGD